MAGLASELSLNRTQELIARLGRAGLTLERAIALMSDDDLVAKWVGAFPVSVTATDNMSIFKITVDYTLDLADMIAAGQYDWVSDEIADKRFPITKQGTSAIELVLVHLDRYVTTEQVEVELDNRGLRAASIAELLAFGAAQPELQRQFPIVALGSRCVLGVLGFVPVLCKHDDARELNLYCYDPTWYDGYRFLAVRKPATAGK